PTRVRVELLGAEVTSTGVSNCPGTHRIFQRPMFALSPIIASMPCSASETLAVAFRGHEPGLGLPLAAVRTIFGFRSAAAINTRTRSPSFLAAEIHGSRPRARRYKTSHSRHSSMNALPVSRPQAEQARL